MADQAITLVKDKKILLVDLHGVKDGFAEVVVGHRSQAIALSNNNSIFTSMIYFFNVFANLALLCHT